MHSLEQVNHIQAYGMDSLVGDDLAAAISHCEAHGLYFGYSLVAAVIRVLNGSATGVIVALNTDPHFSQIALVF